MLSEDTECTHTVLQTGLLPQLMNRKDSIRFHGCVCVCGIRTVPTLFLYRSGETFFSHRYHTIHNFNSKILNASLKGIRESQYDAQWNN